MLYTQSQKPPSPPRSVARGILIFVAVTVVRARESYFRCRQSRWQGHRLQGALSGAGASEGLILGCRQQHRGYRVTKATLLPATLAAGALRRESCRLSLYTHLTLPTTPYV